jgi:hypothetical protein
MTVTEASTDTTIASQPMYTMASHDIYKDIHKGIRTGLFAVTNEAGRTDASDGPARAQLLGGMRASAPSDVFRGAWALTASVLSVEATAEDPGGVDSEPGSTPNTVTLVAPTPDRTTERTWAFTGSAGSFPSWAWP